MGTRISTTIMKIIAGPIVAASLTGCYSFSSITKSPDKSDSIIVSSPGSGSESSAYISNVQVTLNNTAANANDGFVKKVIEKLQQSNRFKEVSYGLYAKKPESPYIDLSYTVAETQDMNMGGNLTKAFFTGFTLFILAPVLPNTYDFYTDHSVQATLPNGTKRDYRASCAGSASGTFPYTGLVQEYGKMTGAATEKCMTAVINQLTSDNLKQ